MTPTPNLIKRAAEMKPAEAADWLERIELDGGWRTSFHAALLKAITILRAEPGRPAPSSQTVEEEQQDDHARVDGVPSDRPMGSTASSIEPEWWKDSDDEEYVAAYEESFMSSWVAFTVQRERKSRGWTQAQLGGRCGLPQPSVARLEDGARTDGRYTTRLLARVFAAMNLRLRLELAPRTVAAMRDELAAWPSLEEPTTTNAVDPSAQLPGMPTPRDATSFVSDSSLASSSSTPTPDQEPT